MPEKLDSPAGAVMAVTHDHLLDGRIRYMQPAHGFRSGIEPIILAAAIPLRPGERLLEGGSGAGAALLCAAERVPDSIGVGIEADPALARLAQANADANSYKNVMFVAADMLVLPIAGRFDHACANPPYHGAGGTRSPVPGRDRAKTLPDGALDAWARALAGPLRHRGTLTFILPTPLLSLSMRAMEDAGCRIDAVLPLWPKIGLPAKLILIQAIKGGRGYPRLLPGLVLHEADGRFTAAASAILRSAAPLILS